MGVVGFWVGVLGTDMRRSDSIRSGNKDGAVNPAVTTGAMGGDGGLIWVRRLKTV